MDTPNFYSDKPIQSAEEDQLARSHYAATLAKAILNLKKEDTFTIGLHGKWGIGKTSIVNMTLGEIDKQQKNLAKDERLAVLRFAPWSISSTDQLISQFLMQLSNVFSSKTSNIRKLVRVVLTKYAKSFDWAKLLPGGEMVATLAQTGRDIAKGVLDNSDAEDLNAQKNDIVKLLHDCKRRILVVIDDIDRLPREQIRQVFQLVTAVADFPNIVYMLVFDRDIVIEALSGVQMGNGSDYLEKVIQIPIAVPDIGPARLQAVLNERLSHVRDSYSDTDHNENQWTELFPACVAPFVDNLRRADRLCNMAEFKLSSIGTEVDAGDLIAVTAIEMRYPRVYDWIRSNKGQLTSDSFAAQSGPALSVDRYREQCRAVFRSLLESDGETDIDCAVDKIETALTTLFPHFGARMGTMHVALYDRDALRRFNRIAHYDKFDRYFDLDIDSISVRRSEVRRAVSERNPQAISRTILQYGANGTAEEFLQELEAMRSDLPAESVQAVTRALLLAAPKLEACSEQSFMVYPLVDRAVETALALLDAVNSSNKKQILAALVADTSIEVSAVALTLQKLELSYGRMSEDGQVYGHLRVVTLSELQELETAFMDRIMAVPSDETWIGRGDWKRVFILMEYISKDKLKMSLEAQFTRDEKVAEFTAEFIDLLEFPAPSYKLSDTNSALLEKYLPKERILEAIHSMLSSGRLFDLDELIQKKCCAFVLHHQSAPTNPSESIPSSKVDHMLSTWA